MMEHSKVKKLKNDHGCRICGMHCFISLLLQALNLICLVKYYFMFLELRVRTLAITPA